MFFKKHWAVLFVLLIVVFSAISNYIVLRLDNTPPVYDELNNWCMSYDIHHDYSRLEIGKIVTIKTYEWFRNLGSRERPPFYYLFLSLFHNVSHEIDFLRMTNMLFFTILLFSTYGIGKELKNKTAGVLAVFIVSVFPAIFAMSRLITVDFPLTSILALTIFLMLKTAYFTSRKYSVLCGIAAGLGMLTKVPFLMLFGPALLYYIIVSFVKAAVQRKIAMVLGNIFLFFIISAMLSASWYVPNINNVIARAYAMSFGLVEDGQFIFIEYYLKQLCNYHIGHFFYLLGITCFILCLRPRTILLVIWFVVPLFLFSFSTNKCPRFILPLLPPVALMIAFCIASISLVRIKKDAITIVIVIGLLLFFLNSNGKINNYPKGRGRIYSSQRLDYGILFPLHGVDWKVAEIGGIIMYKLAAIGDRGRSYEILSIFNIGEVNSALNYYLKNKGVNVGISCPAEADFFNSMKVKDFCDMGGLLKTDFVMMKSGYQGVNAGNIPWIELLTEEFRKNQDRFVLIETIRGLPDDSNIYLYKNKNAK